MKKSSFIMFFVVFALLSCRRGDFGEVAPNEQHIQFSESGFWVVNEGQFGFANGEVSFINPNTYEVQNSVFASANGFQPGDIPFRLFADGNIMLLTVNSSSKVYILNRHNFKIKHTISSIISPREIVKVSNLRYAVSSFANDSIYFLSLNDGFPVVSPLYTGKSTESLMVNNNLLYASNWSSYGGNYDNTTVQIINIQLNQLTGYIQVGKEPNSMVIDKNNRLWILCGGGFMNEEIPRLFKINLLTNEIEKEFVFPSQYTTPFSLSIDSKGEFLFFINKHIYRMHVNDTLLPSAELINGGNKNFYALGTDIYEDIIIVADAGNYQVPGKVILYNMFGQEISSFIVGIIPGYILGNRN